jgi:hypothetical protein
VSLTSVKRSTPVHSEIRTATNTPAGTHMLDGLRTHTFEEGRRVPDAKHSASEAVAEHLPQNVPIMNNNGIIAAVRRRRAGLQNDSKVSLMPRRVMVLR